MKKITARYRFGCAPCAKHSTLPSALCAIAFGFLFLPLAAHAVTVSDVTVNADGTLSKPDNFWTANASGMASALSGSFLTGLSGHNVSELANDAGFITSLSGLDGSGLTGVLTPYGDGGSLTFPIPGGGSISGNQLSHLFDGTGGLVAAAYITGSLANDATNPTASYGYSDIASLFDGSGGNVYTAANVVNLGGHSMSELNNDFGTPWTTYGYLDSSTVLNAVSGACVAQAINSYNANNAIAADWAGSGWPTSLSGFSNDCGFLTDVSGASVSYASNADYANSAGSADSSSYANSAGTAANASCDAWGNDLGSLFTGEGGNVNFAQNAATVVDAASAPAATDLGTVGQMVFTDTHTYRCFASGDWRRTPVTYTSY